MGSEAYDDDACGVRLDLDFCFGSGRSRHGMGFEVVCSRVLSKVFVHLRYHCRTLAALLVSQLAGSSPAEAAGMVLVAVDTALHRSLTACTCSVHCHDVVLAASRSSLVGTEGMHLGAEDDTVDSAVVVSAAAAVASEVVDRTGSMAAVRQREGKVGSGSLVKAEQDSAVVLAAAARLGCSTQPQPCLMFVSSRQHYGCSAIHFLPLIVWQVVGEICSDVSDDDGKRASRKKKMSYAPGEREGHRRSQGNNRFS